MRVTLLYFAALRDLAGRDTEPLDLPAQVRTAAELLAELERRPAFEGRLVSVRVAVNESFVAPDAALRDGDVVALIPPVQGG